MSTVFSIYPSVLFPNLTERFGEEKLKTYSMVAGANDFC